jgi:GxxExxY protein
MKISLTSKKPMYQLTENEKKLSTAIVDAAYKVHKQLGPGLLEKIYEICLCYELSKKDIKHSCQVDIPIIYDGVDLNKEFKLDILVDDSIICELKAVEKVNPVWEAQILSHLKLSGKRVGFVINFNVPLIKDGIRRYCM